MGSTPSRRAPERLSGDDGVSLVEYGLLVALIALVCIGAIRSFQQNVAQSLSKSSSAIVTAANSGP
jgi:Flp pilus assembly pilin Flp